MKQDFSIKEFMYDQLIKDDKKQVYISPDALESIYHFLIEKLDSPAREAGLRMSLFEQEFPTVSSFTLGYANSADRPYLQENVVSNVDSIKIIHTEQRGTIYKIKVIMDGKEVRLYEDELNNLISSIIGEEVEIPERYNPREFQPILDKLLAQDVEVDYNDNMDVS